MSRELSYCRVDQWHAAGYTGKGIKVLVYEVANPTMINYPDYAGRVKDPLGICFSSIRGTHMEDVVDTLLLYAPDVEVIVWRDNLPAAVQYCIDNNVDVFNYSASGSYNTAEFNALEEKAIANGTLFVCSAGNDGYLGLTGMSQKDTWLSVGALRMDPAGNIGRTYYSSYDGYGNDLDVMGFGDQIFPNTHFPGETKGVTGTSFSSPSVAGMIACYKQWFYEMKSRKPNWTEVYTFILSNCTDLESLGYDQHTGNGIFIMPEVEKEMEHVVKIKIGSTNAKLDGQDIQFLIAPQIVQNRTMLGLRDLANLLGAQITLNGDEITITYTKG